jgi:hypothetical protein
MFWFYDGEIPEIIEDKGSEKGWKFTGEMLEVKSP